MRICTFNINGLRAVLKRGFGDIATLLNFLQAGKVLQLFLRIPLYNALLSCAADIVCFQETKLTKTELDRDLALVEGWYGTRT